MARDKMTAVETLRKGQEVEPDFLREVVRWTIQELMEAEVSAQIGAERYQRAEERTSYRNGYRPREWDTRVGTLELAVPKLRTGSYFPSWLEPRRRSEQALVAVVTEAYVQGVSTRRVEALCSRWASSASARVRSAGCAPSSTSRSRRSGVGDWTWLGTRTCGSTPATSTCVRSTRSSRWQW